MRLLALFLLFPLAAAADPAFYGTWGTKAQCQGLPLLTGGSLKAAPFRISRDWLRQRNLWCRLDWFPAQSNATSTYAVARARCGEDANRAYWLALSLETSAASLTLFWNETLQNGPLYRCPDS